MKNSLKKKFDAIATGIIFAIYLFLTLIFFQLSFFIYNVVNKIPFIGKIIAILILISLCLKIFSFLLSQAIMIFQFFSIIINDFKKFYINSFNIYISGLSFVIVLTIPYLFNIHWIIYNIATNIVSFLWSFLAPTLLLITFIRWIHSGLLKFKNKKKES